jgi:hypothetical protein
MNSTDGAGTRPAQPESSRHDEIAVRAYRLWQERGSPIGTPEEDWLRAEQEIASPGAQSATPGGSSETQT